MDNQSIAFAQNLDFNGMNYHGIFAYLYVQTGGGGGFFGPPTPATWYAFDARTGDWRFTIENVPAGTTLRSKQRNVQTGRFHRGWNVENMGYERSYCRFSKWLRLRQLGKLTHGQVFDAAANSIAAQSAWIVNTTIPTGLAGSVSVANYGDRVIGSSVNQEQVTLWGLSLESGDEGDLLFNNTWDVPDYWSEMNLTVSGFVGGFTAWSFEDKVGVLFTKETRENFGFSLETGKYLWVQLLLNTT